MTSNPRFASQPPPATGNSGLRTAPHGPGTRVPPAPTSHILVKVLVLALCVVAIGAFLTAIGLSGFGRGTGHDGAAVALAIIPFIIVLVTIRWVDRWEPEPRLLLIFAFLWGAGVAALVSAVLNTAFLQAVYNATGNLQDAEVLTPVISAPLVEESLKGAGIVLIFLLARRQINGPVDGVVYGMMVGAGFAFTENIFYFVEFGDQMGQVFILRGIMSPFIHPLMSASLGLVMGYAARRHGLGALIWAAPVGWVAAVAIHVLWNGSATFGDFFSTYVAIQVPFFLAFMALVIWLRVREKRTIAAHLRAYQSQGWIAASEVAMLTSLAERRRARKWAEQYGPRAAQAMKDFQTDATTLALTRDQVRSGRANLATQVDERTLLTRITHHRNTFLAA